MTEIRQFMWGYQHLLRHGIQFSLEEALRRIGLLLWIGLFYVIDGIGRAIEAGVDKARPQRDRQQVNAPKLGWRLS